MPEFPPITWDIGTAYDFMISLIMLHNPSDYGLRSTWASGMRQRLPARDRDTLESFQISMVISPPLEFLYSLPKPKDGKTLLQVIGEQSPLERYKSLIGLQQADPEHAEIVERVIVRGKWQPEDRDQLQAYYKSIKGKGKPTAYIDRQLDGWAGAGDFGEQLLRSLRVYNEVFFNEEEHRIRHPLQSGLEIAQELAQTKPLPDLLEELSQGVRYHDDLFTGVNELVLAPSFWSSPFIFYATGKRMIILFGARPDNASLDPGELVPDALTSSLNALSDPTRLRILRYLASESLTTTQLANRLRLRTPTVVHHLKYLRTAGLIYVIPGPQKKEINYQTRVERLNVICDMMKDFVSPIIQRES